MRYTKDYKINYEPTLPYLCNIMEDGAADHAKIMELSIERLTSQGIAWVLAKMQMEIFGYPGQGDTITLHTWPVEISRLQFRRDFELYSSSGVMLARSLSQWVIVNLATRKVERVPKFISDCHPHDPKYALEESALRLEPQADSPILATFSVQTTDIDINNHVNNVRYMDWIAKSLPKNYQRPSTVEILFRSEAVENDTVSARGKVGKDGAFNVSLFKNNGNTELTRARYCVP